MEVYSLWIADFDGQNAVQISDPYSFYGGTGVRAEWSFDGQYIAFCARQDANTVKVYVLDAVTGQVITAATGLDFAWSRTANQFVVYEGQSVSRLDVIGIPDGTVHWSLDVFLPSHYQALDWTPDGQTIVFPAETDTSYSLVGIYAVNADGSNFRELTRDTAQFTHRAIYSIQVSPDGRYLLFGSSFGTKQGVSGIAALMVLDLSNGKVRQLASGLSGPIVWSPDSKYIAFGSTEDPEGNRIRSWELFLVALDNARITRLTYDSAAPNGLTW